MFFWQWSYVYIKVYVKRSQRKNKVTRCVHVQTPTLLWGKQASPGNIA